MSTWDNVKGFFKDAYDDVSYVKHYIDDKYSKYYESAEKVGRKLGFDFDNGGLDDKSDAFRHIFASAQASREFGGAAAAAGGYYHEAGNIVDSIARGEGLSGLPQSAMDVFNNKIGREIAVQAEEGKWTPYRLGNEIKNVIDKGDAMTRPSILDYYRK